VAAVQQNSTVTGYETVGWTNPNITYGLCGTPPPAGGNLAGAAPTCNTTGGNGWSFPGTSTATGIGTVPPVLVTARRRHADRYSVPACAQSGIDAESDQQRAHPAARPSGLH